MMRARLLLPLLLLGACSLEPRYVRPIPPIRSVLPPGAPATTGVTLTRRDIFRDPALDAILTQALANSRNLRVALANIEAARAQYRIQRADQFPQIGADASVTRSRSSSSGVSTGTTTGGAGTGTGGTGTGTGTVVTGGASRNRTIYNAGISLASFELDLFGRLHSLSRAAFDEYLATAAGARAARLTLVGNVANAYYQLAADRSALAVAARTAASAVRSVRLTDSRRAGGVAPRTDVDQARTVLETARGDLANYTTLVAQDRNLLELLVGAPVADTMLPTSIETVDSMLGDAPVGLDSTVLLRRPDVVQAELQLMAANARIGAARAEFFPAISLTAAVGFASTALSSLFTGGAFHWSAGPAIDLPIFDGGRRSGDVAYARAQQQVALNQYELAIQTAFREAADSLARRATIDAQLAALRANEAAAEDNYRLSDARYREGVDNFLVSLDSQRTLYAAQQRLAAARLLRTQSLVALYTALGGDERVDPDRSALP